MIFNHYVSPLTQTVSHETLLPLQQIDALVAEDEGEEAEEEDEDRQRGARGSTSPSRRRSSSG